MRHRKTRNHLRTITACVESRKCLVMVTKLLDTRHDDEGSPLSEDDLRLKAGVAATWLQKAETELAQARTNLLKEIELREHEADPDTIRHRRFQAELRDLERRPRRRRGADELAPDVLRLRAEGLIPAAIADALKTSDSTVQKILKGAL